MGCREEAILIIIFYYILFNCDAYQIQNSTETSKNFENNTRISGPISHPLQNIGDIDNSTIQSKLQMTTESTYQYTSLFSNETTLKPTETIDSFENGNHSIAPLMLIITSTNIPEIENFTSTTPEKQESQNNATNLESNKLKSVTVEAAKLNVKPEVKTDIQTSTLQSMPYNKGIIKRSMRDVSSSELHQDPKNTNEPKLEQKNYTQIQIFKSEEIFENQLSSKSLPTNINVNQSFNVSKDVSLNNSNVNSTSTPTPRNSEMTFKSTVQNLTQSPIYNFSLNVSTNVSKINGSWIAEPKNIAPEISKPKTNISSTLNDQKMLG